MSGRRAVTLVRFEGSKLTIAATDSHRMALTETHLESARPELEAIIPALGPRAERERRPRRPRVGSRPVARRRHTIGTQLARTRCGLARTVRVPVGGRGLGTGERGVTRCLEAAAGRHRDAVPDARRAGRAPSTLCSPVTRLHGAPGSLRARRRTRLLDDETAAGAGR